MGNGYKFASILLLFTMKTPNFAVMEQLKQTFCLYDMVCDNPKGNGVEIVHMPSFFTSKPDIETSRAHVHPFYEIVWFRKGKGVHSVDFMDYPVSDNTIFFISPGQVHSFDGNQDSEGIVMKVCTHLLNDGVTGDRRLLKYNVFNAFDSVPYKKISNECAKVLSHIINFIEEEERNSAEIGHTDYLQSLVTMMLIQIQRDQLEQSVTVFSPNRTAHRIFLAFRREIENNFRTMHTVKEYADKLNVSTKTLSNYVAECSEYSPLELINNRVILEAKRMLRYSDKMVKQIASELGFDDPSYFNKFFKRLVKCSAAEYRTPE